MATMVIVPERLLLWICVTVDHGTVFPAFQVVWLSREPGGEVQGFQGVGPVPGALPERGGENNPSHLQCRR